MFQIETSYIYQYNIRLVLSPSGSLELYVYFF